MCVPFWIKSKKVRLVTLLSILFFFPISVNGQDHELWNDFTNNPKSSRFVDWSSSGYDSGNSSTPTPLITHNVTTYGAIANDGIDDRTAVQNAINAAASNGGGVVFFPSGQYDFWKGPNGHSLEINTSNIVLRGASDSSTTLMQHNYHEGSIHYERYYLINVESPYDIKGTTILFSQNAYRHDYDIKLTSTAGISDGDIILIQMVRPTDDSDVLSREFILPLIPESSWTGFNKFFPIEQMVTVKKVKSDGQTLTLKQSLHADYLTQNTARVRIINDRILKNIGVENLKLKGSWTRTYKHHGSFEDDYGWNALGYTGVVNSWIRNITVENMGTDINLQDSGFCTVENIKNVGNHGHSGIAVSHSYSNLIRNYTSPTYRTHTIGIANTSSGNVFTNIMNTSGLQGAIDFHGSGPSNSNLIENSSNLRISSGGAERNMPHAGQNNTFWNISAGPIRKHEDMFTSGLYNYSDYSGAFDEADLHQLFPKSIIVGITKGNHTLPITVDGNTTKRVNDWYYIDAVGEHVTPTSLFKAQKELNSLGLKKLSFKENFKIFPNPLNRNDDLQINFGKNSINNCKISLLDISGKEIKTFTKTHLKNYPSNILKIKNWSNNIKSGIYLLKVSMEQDFFIKKIIIK